MSNFPLPQSSDRHFLTRRQMLWAGSLGWADPQRNPVTPEDVAATIYHALGIDPESRISDVLRRPHSVALGKPITEILE